MTKRHLRRRIRYRTRRGIVRLGRGIRMLLRALIPLAGLVLIGYAAWLVHPAFGFLTYGLELMLIDWWIEQNGRRQRG